MTKESFVEKVQQLHEKMAEVENLRECLVCEFVNDTAKDMNSVRFTMFEGTAKIIIGSNYSPQQISEEVDKLLNVYNLKFEDPVEAYNKSKHLSDWKRDCRIKLRQCFPESFFNHSDEFIAHKKANTYFIFSNCTCKEDVDAKILEWFSRGASKGMPYNQEWRNKKYHQFMLDGINSFLGTKFTFQDMNIIYTYLGNACNHQKTLDFLRSGYDFSVLDANYSRKICPDEGITQEDMFAYGYDWAGMLPIRPQTVKLFSEMFDITIYRLFEDGTEAEVDQRKLNWDEPDGNVLFGVEVADWERHLGISLDIDYSGWIDKDSNSTER